MGKKNIVAGFLLLAAFMLYGFALVYFRDYAPGKEAWIAQYAVGKHLEARLAHAHGELFALLNVITGYLLLRLPLSSSPARGISWLALGGMLMPLGILGEILIGLPPIFVLLGGASMLIATTWMGLQVAGLKLEQNSP